jgi:phosphatidate cytidylyltransferase
MLLLLAWSLRRAGQPRILEGAAVTAFGALYVGGLSAHFVLLREMPWQAGLAYADGASLVTYTFLVTWLRDTGAYLAGRTFGRNRPWAHISPRKTLEGSIGGFVFALLTSYIASAHVPPCAGRRAAAHGRASVGAGRAHRYLRSGRRPRRIALQA